MEKDELEHHILRQLDDILSQAERIIGGENDMETIENFFNFSEELKTFFRKNTTNPMILERIELIPMADLTGRIHASDSLISIAGNFLSGGFLRDSAIGSNFAEDVRTAQEYYSSIQFLYKSEIS